MVKGYEVVYARGFGRREFGKDAKVDADTLFQVGSTSKAFTTAALGILVDEGKIRWDDAVVDHLRGFRLEDPWLTRNLTIRDAVTHSSGINDSWYYLTGTMDSDKAVDQLRYISAEAPFRASFRYSNLMYAVAGKVIEAASGTTWSGFIKRRLLQPLRMTRSGTSAYEFWDKRFVAPGWLGTAPAGHSSIDDARSGNLAMPHAWSERGTVAVLPWQNFDYAAAAGSVVSSASDMANWLICHLNSGRFADRQLLSGETMRELHAAQNIRESNRFPLGEAGTGYAMGWQRSEYRGHALLAHGGGIIGFPAYVAMMPDRKVGVVVLSNGPAPRAGDHMASHKAIVLEVFDRFLGVETPGNWDKKLIDQYKAAQEKARKEEEDLKRSRIPGSRLSLPLENYAGAYEDPAGNSGRVEVRVREGRLELGFDGEGAFSGYLEHWHQDLFKLHSNPGVQDALRARGYDFVAFLLDSRGRVSSMSAFNATFRRLDQPGGRPGNK